MAFTSYAALQAEITDWLARADLSTKAPSFITLFEADLRPKFKGVDDRATFTVSTVAGTETITLPVAAKTILALAHTVSGYPPLTQSSPQALLEGGEAKRTGLPTEYTQVSSRTLRLTPTPDAVYTLKGVAQENFDPLSDSNTSNWILEEFPNLYLYGSLGHAKMYMQDSQIEEVNTMYAPALNDFLVEMNRRKLLSGGTSFNKPFLR